MAIGSALDFEKLKGTMKGLLPEDGTPVLNRVNARHAGPQTRATNRRRDFLQGARCLAPRWNNWPVARTGWPDVLGQARKCYLARAGIQKRGSLARTQADGSFEGVPGRAFSQGIRPSRKRSIYCAGYPGLRTAQSAVGTSGFHIGQRNALQAASRPAGRSTLFRIENGNGRKRSGDP